MNVTTKNVLTLTESIKRRAESLVKQSADFGYIVTVTQRPLNPLAMGHHETVVEVRPARVLA